MHIDSTRLDGPTPQRLRKQLLKAAVQDNVHIKQGTRPQRPRRPTHWRFTLPTLAALVLAAASALFLVPGLTAIVPEPLQALTVPAAVNAPARLAAARATAAPTQAPLPVRGGPLTLSATDPLDPAIFPVGVRRIVLDPGHGGKDTGTITPAGLEEKAVALDIALRLRALLQQRGLQVLLTRETDQQLVLRERAQFANDAKADLFVSIHLNWLEPASNRGVETFFLGATQDPYLVQLTSRENRESGYSLADMRQLLDNIYLDLRQQESKQLATSLQQSLFRALRKETPSLRDRGVKSAPFLVLVATQMPAILAEVSCLSNQKEAELLTTDAYRQTIAEALYAGIESYTADLTQAASTGG